MCIDQTEKSRRDFLKTVGAFSMAGSVLPEIDDENFNLPVYDIIVVGAGTAGMPCAIIAAQKGATVLVIDKADRVGGTLHKTGGHMSAGGTKHQLIHQIHDTTEAHYQEVMEISKDTANPDLVRLAVEEAPRTIDWLDSLGFEFAPESPRIVYGHVPYHTARTQYGKDAGESIFRVLKPLWDKYVDSGNIVVKLQHTLHRFLMNEGSINGIIAFSESEQEHIFYGRNIVLAAGGYAANPQLFAKFHPNHPRLINTAADTSTGEVIELAQRIGAKFWNADKHISSLGGIEEIPQSGKADFWHGWAMVFTTSYRPAQEIYVNAEGKRFMDETNPDPDYRERAVAKQTDKKFWIIFDENTLNKEGMTIVPKWTKEYLKTAAEKEQFIWKADSIDALAQKTGLPTKSLQETIALHQKETTKIPKIEQAPFYALLTYATSLISFGGIAVNKNLQVIDNQDKPIGNLYAAGEIIGAGATTGNAFCGGMLVTPALSFGRILGNTLYNKR